MAGEVYPACLAVAASWSRRFPRLSDRFETIAGQVAIDAAATYDGKGSPVGYARRRSYLYMKAEAFRLTRLRCIFPNFLLFGEAADPDRRPDPPARPSASSELFDLCMSALTDKQRAAFEAIYLGNMTMSAYARSVGVKPQAIKWHHKAGIDRIRKQFRKTLEAAVA